MPGWPPFLNVPGIRHAVNWAWLYQAHLANGWDTRRMRVDRIVRPLCSSHIKVMHLAAEGHRRMLADKHDTSVALHLHFHLPIRHSVFHVEQEHPACRRHTASSVRPTTFLERARTNHPSKSIILTSCITSLSLQHTAVAFKLANQAPWWSQLSGEFLRISGW